MYEIPLHLSYRRSEGEEQIAILVEAGTDFLVPETFFRLNETRLCLETCKKTDLPTMGLMGMGSEKRRRMARRRQRVPGC